MSRVVFFCFKQKTAYELRMSDWSSDVCSSDLQRHAGRLHRHRCGDADIRRGQCRCVVDAVAGHRHMPARLAQLLDDVVLAGRRDFGVNFTNAEFAAERLGGARSEEHTSELQSLMRISYAVFCLKQKKINIK